MSEFEHERMQVYRTAIEFLVLADATAAALPRGRAYLADQLRRAASSISLNIAEGAGEFSPPDKARFYRIARRSATESAAIIDACRVLGLANDESVATSRELLLRVVAMLTALVKTLSG
ncbi:MAG: four helix bundle protein [Kofleriaceae bacterium]